MDQETRGSTLKEYCIRDRREELLQQWHYAMNGELTPDAVTANSPQMAWWIDRFGHAWAQEIRSRTAFPGGCPICAGQETQREEPHGCGHRMVRPGLQDLATRYPELARQWDYEKNVPILPTDVSPGSHREVWWRCERGHSWRTSVRTRVAGCGCPVCAGRQVLPGENDLLACFPDLAAEWDRLKNGALTPQMITPGSTRKVWWTCREGHSWRASIVSRTKAGSGCPYCTGHRVLPGFNDLASQEPGLADEWDEQKNGALTPQMVSVGSNRKVWWTCAHGHSYQSVVASRVMRRSGCPYCAGRRVLPGFNDLATLAPGIAAEWHPTLNGALTPEQVTVGSRKKVWWECAYGHVWKSVIYSRTGAKRCGCPVCAGKVQTARPALPDRPTP